MNNSTENVRKIKEDILEASFEVFAEKGYSKANLNEIAANCNTSRTPIYYHFKDKENLHNLALNILIERYDKRIDEILYEDVTLEEKFDNLIDFFVKHSRELYRWQSDLSNGAPDSSIVIYKEFLKRQHEKIESVIEIERVKLQHPGHMSSKDLAATLYLLSNGFFVSLNHDLLDIDVNRFRRSIKELIKYTI